MDYFKLLNLQREPFANTPDPEMFYPANMHAHCLQKLELSVRLRRGLCLVRGDVGTGKTTLCQRMIQTLSGDDLFRVHVILDPCFEDATSLAASLNTMFNGREESMACSTLCEHREMIKQYLYRVGVEENRIIVLIIDEGQKLPGDCLELLRELLNYETNEHKLLQVLLFAQEEIRDLLGAHSNFRDRMALDYDLKPLTRKQTDAFLMHRLQASAQDPSQPLAVNFTSGALRLIHGFTRGYPRKINHLGHNILLNLLIRERTKVTPSVVRRAAQDISGLYPRRKRKALGVAGVAAAAVLTFSLTLHAGYLDSVRSFWQNLDSVENHVIQEQGAGDTYRAPIGSRPESGSFSGKVAGMEPILHESVRTGTPSEESGEHSNPNLPGFLGHATVNQEESLWRMIQRIYGQANVATMRSVVQANSGLSNPDLIYAGQEIDMPVVASRAPEEQERVWIRLHREDELNSAYQKAFRAGPEEFRILTLWEEDSGLQFWVVYDRSFDGTGAARQAKDSLGPGQAGQAEVVELENSGVKIVTAK